MYLLRKTIPLITFSSRFILEKTQFNRNVFQKKYHFFAFFLHFFIIFLAYIKKSLYLCNRIEKDCLVYAMHYDFNIFVL